MFDYKVFIKKIMPVALWNTNDVDVPIFNRDTLDESLDVASMQLSLLKQRRYEPFTKCKILRLNQLDDNEIIKTLNIYRYIGWFKHTRNWWILHTQIKFNWTNKRTWKGNVRHA